MNAFRADIDRYRLHPQQSDLGLVIRNQGLWALGVYRLFHRLVKLDNKVVRTLSKGFGHLAHKWIEITTGISLHPETEVGIGLYIGHFGGVIIHPNAKIGDYCVVMHGVTIGNSGAVGDPAEHVPQLGNRVYVGTGAVLSDNITLGHDSVVGANAFLNKSLPPRAVAVGVPAQVISHKGSFAYVHYRDMEDDPERRESLKEAKHAAAQALIETKPFRESVEHLAAMGSHP